MRITHYGHACVLVEDPADGRGRILIDPGDLAGDISGAGEVDAILVTHEHPDHLDPANLEVLRRTSPRSQIFGTPGVLELLPAEERQRASVLTGESARTMIADWDIVTLTTRHATIYPGLPDVENNSLLIGGRVWHPGDALAPPEQYVEVLLLPIGAPWLKLSEAIDYLRTVAPRVVIPIHDGGLAPAHRILHRNLLTRFAPDGTEQLTPEIGVPVVI